MSCVVSCRDSYLDCSLKTLKTKSVILSDLLSETLTGCQWCTPTLILPECDASDVRCAVLCIETNITAGLLVKEDDAMRVMACLELLGIPWDYENVDDNQNGIDAETGDIKVLKDIFFSFLI